MNGCWSWRRQGFHTKVERASKQEVQLKESRESPGVRSWNKIKKYDQPAPDNFFLPWKIQLGFVSLGWEWSSSLWESFLRPWVVSGNTWQLVLFVRNWFNRLSLHTACQSWLGHVLSRTALSPTLPTLSQGEQKGWGTLWCKSRPLFLYCLSVDI